MSVLINMEMPDRCFACPMCDSVEIEVTCATSHGSYIEYREIDEQTAINGRPDWCPLVPVPPHGRLIDVEKISDHKYTTIPQYRRQYADGKPKSEEEVLAFKFGWNYAIDAVMDNAPTVIEAESVQKLHELESEGEA